jgi:hypothetical protein
LQLLNKRRNYIDDLIAKQVKRIKISRIQKEIAEMMALQH